MIAFVKGSCIMGLYCMYLRKSRADIDAEKKGETETLARHERQLLDISENRGYKIVKIFREVVSGETIAARPEMQKMLTEVREGRYEGVLVMEVERLARGDTIDQGVVAKAFQYSGTKIITPIKTYDPCNEFDEEYFEFGLFMSRREYKAINRRMQRGRAVSAGEGKFVGNRPPYGYRRKKLENEKGFTLEPLPDQAAIVQLIFNWYVNGVENEKGKLEYLGAMRIAEMLNKMQIATQTGGNWSASGIYAILTNPVYIGKIRWKYRPCQKIWKEGEMYTSRRTAKNGEYLYTDGRHPAIVETQLYQRVQNRLHRREQACYGKEKIMQNPLSGLLYCAICGKKMCRKPLKNSEMVVCRTKECNNVGGDLHCIEAKIWEWLQQWLGAYQICTPKEPEKITGTILQNNDLSHLQKRGEMLEGQLEQVYSLLEQGVYTVSEFQSRKEYLERQKQIWRQAEDLWKNITAKSSVNQNQRKVSLYELYCMAEKAEDKNRLLKLLIERVEYEKTESTRWHNTRDTFSLKIYPRIPEWKDNAEQQNFEGLYQ